MDFALSEDRRRLKESEVREVALVAVPDQEVTNRLKAVIVAKEPSTA